MGLHPDDELDFLLLPFSAFLLTILLVPPIRYFALRRGYVSVPVEERWHRGPTPLFGGVAIFVGFFFPAFMFSPDLSCILPIVLVGAQMLLLGIYDDLRRINPASKLKGQIIAAATAIYFGYSLRFFGWPPADAVLTALWIAGLTNALNLLDNMDGLAAGIALIAALYLTYLFHRRTDLQHSYLAMALAAALAGFLIYNFHPASIFMGDAGSLFLGATLSLLTLHGQGHASNILSLVAVPTLLLLVPIIDTLLVTVTRLFRGQPISQGGKDHTSHRLVTLGLTESRAVLLLYVIATISGGTALLIERLSYGLSLTLVPLVVLSFSLFAAYLAQVEIISDQEKMEHLKKKRLPTLLVTLTYKRRLLEIMLDLFLIPFAYYLAFVFRFDFHLDDDQLRLYLSSLPLIMISTYGAFFFFGIYRGVWRYIGLEDLWSLAKGVISATALAAVAILLLYRFTGYSRVVFILYALLLFLGAAASRLSFRFFALLLARPRTHSPAVLIYGAGDAGEVVVRECRRNLKLGYRPVGFLDDDPRKQGRAILGLPVFGGVDVLTEVLAEEDIQGLIISSPSILVNGNAEKVRGLCRGQNLWVKRLRFEFSEEL